MTQSGALNQKVVNELRWGWEGARGRRMDSQIFGSHTKALLPREKGNKSQMKLLSVTVICLDVHLCISPSPTHGRCISAVSDLPTKQTVSQYPSRRVVSNQVPV